MITPTKKSYLSLFFALTSSLAITLLLNSFTPRTPVTFVEDSEVGAVFQIITAELNNLVVCNSPRISTSLSYDKNSCDFTSQINASNQKIKYNLDDTQLTRVLDGQKEVLLEGVKEFKLSFYDKNKQCLAVDTAINSLPAYGKIKISMKNAPTKTFTRTVYYQ